MPRPKKVDPRILALGDPEVHARLQRAAEAAGLQSVSELADVLADSGFGGSPPDDVLTERMTLQDLGERLHAVAANTERTERKTWFARLVETQKHALITTLRATGYSPLAISNDLGVDQLEVEKIYAKHATKLGAQVLGIRLDTLAGQLAMAKHRAQELAKDEPSTYWRIEKDYVSILQDLGVIERAAHRVEIVHQAEDKKKAALERLTKIARQQAVRMEEIKRADFEMVEPEALPQDVEAEYEELRNG